MEQQKGVADLLYVETSDEIGFLFSEISNIFGLSVKIAKSLDEFVQLATVFDFKFVLCNLHLQQNFAGLYLSRMYKKIRKAKIANGKLFFYSFQNNPTLELSKLGLDDLSDEKFDSFYEFLVEYFPKQCKQYFQSEDFKLSMMA